MLFAPGLDGLFRAATDEEVTLWERLVEPVGFSRRCYKKGIGET
jgi:hypothetical protein